MLTGSKQNISDSHPSIYLGKVIILKIFAIKNNSRNLSYS
jgi:hypothetical protein